MDSPIPPATARTNTANTVQMRGLSRRGAVDNSGAAGGVGGGVASVMEESGGFDRAPGAAEPSDSAGGQLGQGWEVELQVGEGQVAVALDAGGRESARRTGGRVEP